VVALVVVEALLGTTVALMVLRTGQAQAGSQARLPTPTAATTVNALNLAAEPLPADCVPAAAGPPTSPYQLGLVGTATGGSLTTGSATVSGIDAKVCGLVTLVNGTPPCYATGYIESPHDGQLYGALSIALTLVPGMNPTVGFTANPGTITGGFNCGTSQNGLSVDLNAAVSGSTAPLFGVSCTIAVTIPLGGAATGPLDSTRATLSSNDFTIPAVQPSPTCPSAVAANVDDIAGLPLAAGRATATLPVTASIYQPAP
jgi:hypothetical protein